MNDTVENLLSRFPEDEHDKPFPLLKEGPAQMERLFGKKKDRSTLYRHATKGIDGVVLESLSPGDEMFSTLRMLVEFPVKVTAAKLAKLAAKERNASTTTEADEATLRRCGIGQKGGAPRTNKGRPQSDRALQGRTT